MLQNLHIRNYALIDQLDLDFKDGFITITGETGSGKSIMLGALGLILGDRADLSSLRNKDSKCIIEGEFDLSGFNLSTFFDIEDLDYHDSTILRREISSSGKSRAFINDTPVTLSILKSLGERLIDIHSQHQTLKINDSSFQAEVLDVFCDNTVLLKDYQERLIEYKKVRNELTELKEKESKAQLDRDYFQFQFEELEKANLKQGELSILESEGEKLEHAEEIKTQLNQVVQILNGDGDRSLVGMLKLSVGAIENIADFSQGYAELKSRLESCLIEIQDIERETDMQYSNVDIDEDQLSKIQSRLDILNGLFHKHRVSTVEELLEIFMNLGEKIGVIGSLEEDIIELEKRIEKLKTELKKRAEIIRDNRLKHKEDLENNIVAILDDLSMGDAKVMLRVEPVEDFLSNGMDTINLLFQANKGGELLPLNKVASGGEISRLMLAIKSILSKYLSLPTIIFDEIDTGVSGDVAYKMGDIMQEMAENMQVISITHLPQIAGKGKNQIKVYKETEGEQTFTKVRLLSEDERVNEIAKMLSGNQLSNAAIENAKVLLQN